MGALFSFDAGPERPTLATRALFATLAARSLGGTVAVLAERTLAPEPALRPLRPPAEPRIRGPARARLAAAANRMRRVLTPERLRGCDRLHLGAGWRYLPGWGNIDLHGRRNLIWDLTRPLPVAPGSIAFIYSEHFIEHIGRDAARRLLANARKALRPGGILRISTPDLQFWASAYLEGRAIQHPHADWFPQSPCAMVNDQMRLWGHQFIYDEAELVRLLRDCGFSRIERVAHGESRHLELRGLESRPPCGDLILEAEA